MINYGCAYYPEQWGQWLPEGSARWRLDAELMAQAGFNTVRLGEFAWSMLEPSPDHFDFSWLDQAIDALNQFGLAVVMSTPTAAAPPWLLHEHPDIAQVTSSGQRRGLGTRRIACANHPIYRQRSAVITESLARHYADHAAVIGWQTDNEFGCHDSARCYCPHCEQGFRDWLLTRYHDLQALNAAWGTAFWSEWVNSWQQITLPTSSAAARNPGQLLDFDRFSSASWQRFQKSQVEILREYCPHHFITHNFMGFYPDLDAYQLSLDLDFVSWDNYHYDGATPGAIAAAHDHTRGILNKPFWVMEQQVGQVNWGVYNAVPPPQFVRLKTYQNIAHGADGVLFFRWRQALAGSEQFHSGLLDYAGRKTQGYLEACQIGDELRRLAPILAGTQARNEVAVLLDYDSRWVLQNHPRNQVLRHDVPDDHSLRHPVLLMDDYDPEDGPYMTGRSYQAWPFLSPYIALWEKNIGVDIIAPVSDLRQYKLIIAPCLAIVPPSTAQQLIDFVRGGGTLVLGPHTGVMDEHARLFTQPQPGPLAELCGTFVNVNDSLDPQRRNSLFWQNIPTIHDTTVGLLIETLAPLDGTEILACYTSDWYAREAAIVRKGYDTGQAIYIGCLGGPILYQTLFDWLLPQIDIYPPMASVAGVEICARYGEDGRKVTFLINHSDQSHTLSLTSPISDLISGETWQRLLNLKPHQVVAFVEFFSDS